MCPDYVKLSVQNASIQVRIFKKYYYVFNKNIFICQVFYCNFAP